MVYEYIKKSKKKRKEHRLKRKGNIALDYDLIRKTINESSLETSIYVGGDSSIIRNKGEKWVLFIVIVGIHIDSNKGVKVFKQAAWMPDYGPLRLRLMNEVWAITAVATELIDHVDDRPFAVHLDINSDVNEKSSIVVKEAIGYVKAMLGVEKIIMPAEDKLTEEELDNLTDEELENLTDIEKTRYSVHVKPEAFMASVGADRFTRV